MMPHSLLLYGARTMTCRGRSRLMAGTIAALCVWIWFAGPFANAQVDRGSVSGTITDPSGAGITGAKVTVTNAAMGTQNSTVATGAGEYTIPELPAGVYSVTVVAPGFTTLVRSGITVSVGETARVDLHLGVGQGATTVTVTEDAPLLQIDSPQNNLEVSTKDMNELPFNVAGIGSIRDPMSFAALAPGTTSTSRARRRRRTASIWTGWTTPRRSRAPSPMKTSPRSNRLPRKPCW